MSRFRFVLRRQIRVPQIEPMDWQNAQVVLSPNEKEILIVTEPSGQETCGRLVRFDLETFRSIESKTLPQGNRVYGCYSPNASHFAVATWLEPPDDLHTDHVSLATVWECSSGSTTHQFEINASCNECNTIALTRDGEYLIDTDGMSFTLHSLFSIDYNLGLQKCRLGNGSAERASISGNGERIVLRRDYDYLRAFNFDCFPTFGDDIDQFEQIIGSTPFNLSKAAGCRNSNGCALDMLGTRISLVWQPELGGFVRPQFECWDILDKSCLSRYVDPPFNDVISFGDDNTILGISNESIVAFSLGDPVPVTAVGILPRSSHLKYLSQIKRAVSFSKDCLAILQDDFVEVGQLQRVD